MRGTAQSSTFSSSPAESRSSESHPESASATQSAMTVRPDDYLDARQPEWEAIEAQGRVRYDIATHSIVVRDRDLVAAIERNLGVRRA